MSANRCLPCFAISASWRRRIRAQLLHPSQFAEELRDVVSRRSRVSARMIENDASVTSVLKFVRLRSEQWNSADFFAVASLLSRNEALQSESLSETLTDLCRECVDVSGAVDTVVSTNVDKDTFVELNSTGSTLALSSACFVRVVESVLAPYASEEMCREALQKFCKDLRVSRLEFESCENERTSRLLHETGDELDRRNANASLKLVAESFAILRQLACAAGDLDKDFHWTGTQASSDSSKDDTNDNSNNMKARMQVLEVMERANPVCALAGYLTLLHSGAVRTACVSESTSDEVHKIQLAASNCFERCRRILRTLEPEQILQDPQSFESLLDTHGLRQELDPLLSKLRRFRVTSRSFSGSKWTVGLYDKYLSTVSERCTVGELLQPCAVFRMLQQQVKASELRLMQLQHASRAGGAAREFLHPAWQFLQRAQRLGDAVSLQHVNALLRGVKSAELESFVAVACKKETTVESFDTSKASQWHLLLQLCERQFRLNCDSPRTLATLLRSMQSSQQSQHSSEQWSEQSLEVPSFLPRLLRRSRAQTEHGVGELLGELLMLHSRLLCERLQHGETLQFASMQQLRNWRLGHNVELTHESAAEEVLRLVEEHAQLSTSAVVTALAWHAPHCDASRLSQLLLQRLSMLTEGTLEHERVSALLLPTLERVPMLKRQRLVQQLPEHCPRVTVPARVALERDSFTDTVPLEKRQLAAVSKVSQHVLRHSDATNDALGVVARAAAESLSSARAHHAFTRISGSAPERLPALLDVVEGVAAVDTLAGTTTEQRTRLRLLEELLPTVVTAFNALHRSRQYGHMPVSGPNDHSGDHPGGHSGDQFGHLVKRFAAALLRLHCDDYAQMLRVTVKTLPVSARQLAPELTLLSGGVVLQEDRLSRMSLEQTHLARQRIMEQCVYPITKTRPANGLCDKRLLDVARDAQLCGTLHDVARVVRAHSYRMDIRLVTQVALHAFFGDTFGHGLRKRFRSKENPQPTKRRKLRLCEDSREVRAALFLAQRSVSVRDLVEHCVRHSADKKAPTLNALFRAALGTPMAKQFRNAAPASKLRAALTQFNALVETGVTELDETRNRELRRVAPHRMMYTLVQQSLHQGIVPKSLKLSQSRLRQVIKLAASEVPTEPEIDETVFCADLPTEPSALHTALAMTTQARHVSTDVAEQLSVWLGGVAGVQPFDAVWRTTLQLSQRVFARCLHTDTRNAVSSLAVAMWHNGSSEAGNDADGDAVLSGIVGDSTDDGINRTVLQHVCTQRQLLRVLLCDHTLSLSEKASRLVKNFTRTSAKQALLDCAVELALQTHVAELRGHAALSDSLKEELRNLAVLETRPFESAVLCLLLKDAARADFFVNMLLQSDTTDVDMERAVWLLRQLAQQHSPLLHKLAEVPLPQPKQEARTLEFSVTHDPRQLARSTLVPDDTMSLFESLGDIEFDSEVPVQATTNISLVSDEDGSIHSPSGSDTNTVEDDYQYEHIQRLLDNISGTLSQCDAKDEQLDEQIRQWRGDFHALENLYI
ncbi:MAG: hypothetical protein MHM6MM_006719, partial [Cercozoa sp. M6MM]